MRMEFCVWLWGRIGRVQLCLMGLITYIPIGGGYVLSLNWPEFFLSFSLSFSLSLFLDLFAHFVE